MKLDKLTNPRRKEHNFWISSQLITRQGWEGKKYQVFLSQCFIYQIPDNVKEVMVYWLTTMVYKNEK